MPLESLAARASADPYFFGHALRQFATARCLTNAQLAAWLGCSPETLTHIRICRTPETDEHFAQIASKFGVSEEKLREVIRG